MEGPSRIVYRSLWERKLMVYCDTNNKVLEWERGNYHTLPFSPWDNKVHRYYPDFYMKVEQKKWEMEKIYY